MRPTPSALVLSLRRLAEVEAKQQLGLCRTQLEWARLREGQAQKRLQKLDQQLAFRTAQQRAAAVPISDGSDGSDGSYGMEGELDAGPGAGDGEGAGDEAGTGRAPRLPADALRALAEASRVSRARRAECARALQSEAALAARLLREVARLEELWRLSVGRREAAELYEAEQRRVERRARVQQQRAHEDEARERFASARQLSQRSSQGGPGGRH